MARPCGIQGLGVGAALSDVVRFLPRPSLSLGALLCLLFRWFGLSAQQGGLRSLGSRHRALSLALALLEGIAVVEGVSAFELSISFDASWACRLPIPTKLVDSMSFVVGKRGFIGVSDLRDEVLDGHLPNRHMKMRWLNLMMNDCLQDGHRPPPAELLPHKDLGSKSHHPFFGQLFLHPGQRSGPSACCRHLRWAAVRALSCESTSPSSPALTPGRWTGTWRSTSPCARRWP